MGVDVNARGGVSAGTALDRAASGGHVEIVEYLLSCGAELDVSEPDRNPLFSAIYDGSPEVARLLLQRGIDPHVCYERDSGGLRNAFSFAQEYGQTEIAELLIAVGCTLPPVADTSEGASTHDELIAAMAAEFGEVSELALHEIVPVDDDVHVAVHRIGPSDKHACLTLFTTGMSDRPMTAPEGQEDYRYAELLIHLPADWPLPLESESGDAFAWPVSWLRQIAYHPHQSDTWLGGRHTIISNAEPPEPLAPKTALSCMLVIADLAGWSPVKVGDGKQVHFYTLIPIYAAERDLETEIGVHELLHRFEQNSVTTIVDVSRVNVAEQA
jgi:hypothetical protein